MLDRIIKGGTVVDGTGAAPFTADVGIEGGKIVEVGRITAAARETLDADGLVVTPGFVDIHTHYDGQVSWDAELSPSSWHGVTSVVMGNCGVGFAPARPDRREWLIGLMEGVEDIPGSALSDGIDWQWETFPEYMDAIAARPMAVDVGAQMAHGALRAYVMGERGARNEAATADDMAEMARLVREAQGAGALGFSTSRTIVHKAVDGEPVPGTFAAEAELHAIAQALAEAGHGVMEVAPAGIAGEDLIAPAKEIDWMNRVSAKTGCPITFLYAQNPSDPGAWREMMASAAKGSAAGGRVTPQVVPRGVGLMVSLEGRLQPFAWTPTWKALSHLSHAERIARLQADPDLRRRLVEEGADSVTGVHKSSPSMPIAYHWDRTWSLGSPPDYEPDPSQSIEGRARRAGRNPRELALEIMLEDNGRGFLYYTLLGYADGDLNPSYEMMRIPNAVVGGSDGGAHVAVVCDAGMPTFMLSHWARDRTRGPRLPLEFCVRKMTHDAAALYGLKDRGVIRAGMKADLNVIDFQRLNSGTPYMAHDLPTGAPRLLQTATGYEATLVSGEVTRRRGEDTGARPGGVIRGRA